MDSWMPYIEYRVTFYLNSIWKSPYYRLLWPTIAENDLFRINTNPSILHDDDYSTKTQRDRRDLSNYLLLSFHNKLCRMSILHQYIYAVSLNADGVNISCECLLDHIKEDVKRQWDVMPAGVVSY